MRSASCLLLIAALAISVAPDAGAKAKAKRVKDRKAPTGTFAKPANPFIVVFPTSPRTASEAIIGDAEDVGTGVSSVTVWFQTCGMTSSPTSASACTTTNYGANSLDCRPTCAVRPALTCSSKRDHCSFTVLPPSYKPGYFLVRGEVIDKARNKGRIAPIRVLVL